MYKINFDILGKKWQVRVLKRKKYMKKNGRDSVAITDIDKRRIDISPYGMNLETVVHELLHAYLGEMCTRSADFDDDALEEIFAEFMAKRGRELLDVADTIYDKILTLVSDKVEVME